MHKLKSHSPMPKRANESSAFRFLALFAVVFMLLVLRRPDAITNPQFWAEDGPVFFFEQITSPGIGILFRPYAGYLHLVPRLVTAFASLFGSSFAPLVMNLWALLIAALCCSLFSLNRYRYLLQSDWLRIVLCLVMATAFQADELVGNITCVSFFLFIGALLIILQPAESYSGRYSWVLPVLGSLLCGFSGPVVIILLPLCAWIAIKDRGPAALASVAVALAGVVQACIYLSADLGRTATERFGDILVASLASVAYRVVLTPIFGLTNAQLLSRQSFDGVLLVTMIAVTAWLTSLWWQGDTSLRRKVVVCIYLAFIPVVLAIAGRSLAKLFLAMATPPRWGGERYFLAGACMFAYLVALSLERWMPTRRMAQVVLLAAIFALGTQANFHTLRFTDYQWQKYSPMVDRWIRDRNAGHSTEALSIPINPAPWKLELTGTERYTPGPVVPNGGFEGASLTPWMVWNTGANGVVVTTVQCRKNHSGACSLQEMGGSGITFQEIAGLTPGSTYEVAVWALSDPGTTAKAALWAHDTAGQNGALDGSRTPSSTQWERFAVRFIASETGKVRIHLNYEIGHGAIYWDDVAISKML
jgi:hypothetical protein